MVGGGSISLRFWGARGSIAAPLSNRELASKIEAALQQALEEGLHDVSDVGRFVAGLPWPVGKTAGGDTSCVEVRAGGELLILDAGTGIRPLGLELVRNAGREPVEAHILLSHTHWDHICGFPFFVPAFVPGSKLTIASPHEGLESRFRRQQHAEFFPVSLDSMAADIRFVELEPEGQFRVGEVDIATLPLSHPGGSFGYRISYNGGAVVYATDSEYKELSQVALEPYHDFFRGADVLIFDAQYTLAESVEKEHWGHSTAFVGIDMALEAGVKQLLLTHHEPTYDDRKLWDIQQQAMRYLELQGGEGRLGVELAYEGMEILIVS